MHIILGLLSVLGAIGFFLWRMDSAARAARELADVAGEVANLPRKMRFRSKASKRGIDVIDDSREAAAALVYGAAVSKGDPTAADRALIVERLANLFEVSSEDATELLSRAAWHVGALNDPVNAVNPLVDRLVREVGREACASLVTLMGEVVDLVDGPGAAAARYYIDKTARRAGLR